MQITQDAKVTLTLTLTTNDQTVIAEYKQDNPLVYLHGHNQLLKGLESELENQTVGYGFEIELSAEDAYGEYDETALQTVSITAFEGVDDMQEGMQVYANTAEGSVPVTIVAIDAGMVTLDANPQFAGQGVSAVGAIIDVEDAGSADSQIKMGGE